MKSTLPNYYLGFGLSLFTVATAQAQNAANGRVAKPADEPLGVNLQIGPAEKIAMSERAMKQSGFVFDAGAKPVMAKAEDEDFHHLGVYVYRGEERVTDADVRIVCDPVSDADAIEVPVARLYAKDQGPEAAHFGNNVKLEAGTYRVNVLVDGNSSANFLVDI